MKENNNHNMMYLSVVAIVAIVAVVMLVGNNGATMTKTQTNNEENLVGQGINAKTGELLNNNSAVYFYNGANIQANAKGLVFNVKDNKNNVWKTYTFTRDGRMLASEEINAKEGFFSRVGTLKTESPEIISDNIKTKELYLNGINIHDLINNNNTGITREEVYEILRGTINTFRGNPGSQNCKEICKEENKECFSSTAIAQDKETDYIRLVLPLPSCESRINQKIVINNTTSERITLSCTCI
jgi:hypothetical protein